MIIAMPCAMLLLLLRRAESLDGEVWLKRAMDDDAVDVRLPCLPDAVDTANHLLLDCDVGLWLADNNVARDGEGEAGSVALGREEEGLHRIVRNECAKLVVLMAAAAKARRAHAVHRARACEQLQQRFVPREDDRLGLGWIGRRGASAQRNE
jgi:hypothetical protein